jgi:hypothetical protein
MEVQLHAFLISALEGDTWSVISGFCIPGEKALSTHWLGGRWSWSGHSDEERHSLPLLLL